MLAPFKVTPVFNNEALVEVPSFIANPLVFNKRCSAPVLPIVVVPANLATPAPLCDIVKPLESTTAKLLESSKILTPSPGVILITSSVLVTDTSAPAAPPKAALPVY